MTVDTLARELTEAERRLAWRKQLPEYVCRELASEAQMAAGKHGDPAMLVDLTLRDAWLEYQERYAESDRVSSLGLRKNKKIRKRRNSQYR